MKNPGLPEFIANNRLVISGDAWIWICRYQIFENEDKTKGRDPLKKNVFFRALPELPNPPP